MAEITEAMARKLIEERAKWAVMAAKDALTELELVARNAEYAGAWAHLACEMLRQLPPITAYV